MKSEITTSALSNGFPVITINIPKHTTVTALILTRAGLYFENKKTNGHSHFLEHVCFKGSKKWSNRELMHYLDNLGAETNAFTAEEFTGFYAKGAPQHVSNYLEAISDVFLNPLFPEDEIVKERGVIKGEYDMYEDQPMYQAQKLLSQTMFGDQPAGWQILGSKQNIGSMTSNDARSLHRKHYNPQNSLLLVAGPVNHKQVINQVEQLLGSAQQGKRITRKKVNDKQTDILIGVKKAESEQVHICIAFRGFPRCSEKRPIAQIIGALLGSGMSSRLYERIREQLGAGYYVSSNHISYVDHGYLEIRVGTESSRVSEVITAILKEIERLKFELVSENELEKVKNYLIGHSYMGLETSDSWAEFVGVQSILDGTVKTLEEKLEEITKVTANDIQKLARVVFVKNKMTVVAFGNTNKKDVEKAVNAVYCK